MSTNINDSSSTENLLPLTEVMQVMLQDLQGFQETLKQDKSDQAVHQVMDKLSKYKIDNRLSGKISIFLMETMDIQHTPTHEELVNDINTLIDMLEEGIQAQQHKENVKFVRAILKVMIKHADEVTCWLEESMK